MGEKCAGEGEIVDRRLSSHGLDGMHSVDVSSIGKVGQSIGRGL